MGEIRYIKTSEADIELLMQVRLEMLREVNDLSDEYVYDAYGLGWACGALVIGIVVLFLLLYGVAHSRTFDRMSLHTSIDSTNATTEQLSIKVGDTGRALTRLALVGNAEIAGKQVEVKSSGDFINPGTPIRVVSVNEAQIIVSVLG